MRYLVKYKIFESSVNNIVEDYLRDCKWNIKESLGNCAFFAKDFYEWCQSKGIDCRLIYLKQDENFSKDEIEDHIVPMVDNYFVDFVFTTNGVSRRVRENSTEALERQSDPEITHKDSFLEKYSKWGYYTMEEISYNDAYTGDNRKCWSIDYPNKITESIKVPIKVGDTILGGRFKNKKMVVKKIGKNKKGDITVNDKPLLKFRILKESLMDDVEINLSHLKDVGFETKIYDNKNGSYHIRVWLPTDRSLEYSYDNSRDFNWIDIEDEIVRFFAYLSENYEISILYTIASKDQDGLGFKRTEWNVDNLIKQGTFGYANPGKIKTILIECFEK